MAFSFIIPYFSSYSYKFCPRNPQNGFICYCIYKSNSTNNNADNLLYSSGVKKQVDVEKLSFIALSIEALLDLIENASERRSVKPYKLIYKNISQKIPDKPPAS